MSVHDEAISQQLHAALRTDLPRSGHSSGLDKRTCSKSDQAAAEGSGYRVVWRLLRLSVWREGMQAELIHLIDVVTTNKTDFFREPGIFRILWKRRFLN